MKVTRQPKSMSVGVGGWNSIGHRLLDTLEANEIFGEMALIDDKPRSATAIALSDVALVPISEMQFLLLVTRKPAFALEVMRVLARRLRAANKAL